MNVPREIDDLLDEADDLPYGVTRRNLVAEAVRLADDAGDEELAYRLRGRLISDAKFSGADEVALVAFIWCLARNEEDPVRFPAEGLGFRLDWQFKWIVSGLPDVPSISRERATAALDVFRARIARTGAGHQAAAKLELRLAMTFGDLHLVEGLLDRWQRTPRDRLSDCAACDVATLIKAHLLLDRPAEAVGAAAPLLAGDLECAEQPEGAFGSLLLALHELGRTAEAAEVNARGYHLIRDNPSFLGALVGYLADASLRDQHARAVVMVERHLPWLVSGDPAPMAWAAVALATRRAARSGLASTSVRVPHGLLPGAALTMPAEALAEAAEARALELATEFDDRNGNGVVSGRVRKLLAMAPGPGSVEPTVAPPPPLPEVVVTGDDVEDALMRARQLLWSDRIEEGAAAALEAAELAERAGRAGPAAVGRALQLRATAAEVDGGAEELEVAARRIVSAAEASGDEQAVAEVSRTMAIVLGDEALAQRALLGAERQPPWLRALIAAVAGAFAGADGRLPEARELFARGLAAAEESRVAVLILALLGRSAEAAFDAEDFSTAVGLASRATKLALASEHVAQAGFASLVAADAAWALGEEGTGFDHQRAAVAHLRSAGLDEPRAQAEAVLGSRLLDNGDAQQAADVLERVADEMAGLGQPLLAARARQRLARARREAGMPLQALISADEAAAALEEEDPRAAAVALFEAGLSLDTMDRDAEAAERFTRAAACFSRAEDPCAALDARRRAAVSRGWAGEPAAACGDLAAVVGEARAAAEPWLVGAASDDLARQLTSLERHDEALAAATAAVTAFDEAGDGGSAAWSSLLRGQTLAGLQSPDAAGALAEARARLESEGQERGVALVEEILDDP